MKYDKRKGMEAGGNARIYLIIIMADGEREALKRGKGSNRKVDPKEMLKRSARIMMIKQAVPFAVSGEMYINEEQSVLDSGFPVDRKVVKQNLELYKGKWELGELPIGHEWLAFTFRDQEYNISEKDYDEMFENSEKIVNDAYNRMDLPVQSWNKHQKKEVEYIIQKLKDETIHTIIDFGCGNGRHALEFAQKGFDVTGVDYSKGNIKSIYEKGSLFGARFLEADCRTVDLHKTADLALCLYDVIGSFINDHDNYEIIKNINRHLKLDGVFVLSVMNLELTNHIAKHTVDNVRKNPKALVKLPPSKIMQKSGDIFAPDYFLLELETGIVYRKEQFENEGDLSAEYVIRDKRFTRQEITGMLEEAGFSILEIRCVRAGRWENDLDSKDPNAKEILIIARKIKNL